MVSICSGPQCSALSTDIKAACIQAGAARFAAWMTLAAGTLAVSGGIAAYPAAARSVRPAGQQEAPRLAFFRARLVDGCRATVGWINEAYARSWDTLHEPDAESRMAMVRPPSLGAIRKQVRRLDRLAGLAVHETLLLMERRDLDLAWQGFVAHVGSAPEAEGDRTAATLAELERLGTAKDRLVQSFDLVIHLLHGALKPPPPLLRRAYPALLGALLRRWPAAG